MSVYRQAAESLADGLRDGTYAKDGILLGEHELAKRLGVARETARKAIAELARRGLVERRRGVGTFHVRRKSSAIDTGDPSDDYGNEPKLNGRRVNLGAYGNTSEAAHSPGGMALILY